jgi:hypothetical protein
MKNKILTQGHFDGFCLLYAVMNSYKALVSPRQIATTFSVNNFHKWAKIISITPSLQNFASGEGSDFGVSRNSTDIELKARFIQDCFTVLTEGMKAKIHTRRETIENLINVDFQDSIIILCVNEKAKFEHGSVGDHWVSLVGRDDDEEKFLVCCSFTPHEHYQAERLDGKTGRMFNNTISLHEIKKSKIYVNSIQSVVIGGA